MCNTIALCFVLAAWVFLPVTAHCTPGQSVDTGPGQGLANIQTEAWKEEFDRICAQTEIATGLSKTQLQKLISDTNELLGKLAKVEDPWAKVYIFRLNKCLDFFKFTLEWQEMQSQGDTP